MDNNPTVSNKAPESRFRRRVILLGVVLIPVNSLWIARTEAMDYSGFPTCASLFFNVIFSLLVLLAINSFLNRKVPCIALSRQELMVIYAMLATGSSLVGHDCMQMVVPSVTHATFFVTPENRWAETAGPYLPDWMTIKQLSNAVSKYELGNSTLYKWEHIKAWLTPVFAWSAFILTTTTCMLSINLILRKHWVSEERLAYPIVQIPLLITEGGGSNQLFRNKLFWLGFGIAAGIDILNGIAKFVPSLPTINTKLADISYLWSGSPILTRAMWWTPVSFYPFVIGLSFFMPTNMAFSSWFFYFFRKSQQVTAAFLGYPGGDPWFPYLKEQAFGALIALFASVLWFGRGYLKQVWEEAKLRTNDGNQYRWALAALAVGLTGMSGFLIAMGLTPIIAVVYVVLYMMFCGAITRLRAELGPPAHEMGWVGTTNMMVTALGAGILGPQNLTVFSLLHFQNRMHRGLLMPQQAEALKAASQCGLRIRTMAAALAIAAVVGVLAAFWALLHLGYSRTHPAVFHPGAPGSAFAREALNILMSWINTPAKINPAGIAAMGVGGLFALILAKLNVTFCGFPFHPAGYALGMAFGIDYIWLPVMISWFFKVLILRYWGRRGYQAAIPFFAGLVLGEFAAGGMWSFVRGVLGVETYTFFY